MSSKRLPIAILFLAVPIIALVLSGCEPFERMEAGARVAPMIGRSVDGQGGLDLRPPPGAPPNTPVPDVFQLRVASPKPVDLDKLAFPGEAPGTAYRQAADSPRMRNRLQDQLRMVSDQICALHKSDILAASATINATLSAATSALGAAGAIITGATAARVFAGAAGFTNALRDNANENVFYNKFADAIIRQINKQRDKKWKDILTERSRTEYSVDAAILDIQDYHNQCSFYEAIAALGTEERRPLTADELRGKIDSLRVEITKNEALIKTAQTPATRVELERANQALAHAIQGLTVQLGLAHGAPTPPSAN